jgi:hypothetical protein
MDQSGHTTLAEWTAEDAEAVAAAEQALYEQLAAGYYAVVSRADGTAEQVSKLPSGEPLIVLRRPIAGG